jgi:hypothetical protein
MQGDKSSQCFVVFEIQRGLSLAGQLTPAVWTQIVSGALVSRTCGTVSHAVRPV